MGRFRIQLFLLIGQRSSKELIEKNTNYSFTSTEWTLINIDFREPNYGIK